MHAWTKAWFDLYASVSAFLKFYSTGVMYAKQSILDDMHEFEVLGAFLENIF